MEFWWLGSSHPVSGCSLRAPTTDLTSVRKERHPTIPVHPRQTTSTKEPGIRNRSMVLVFGTTGTPSERSWFAWMPWVCPTEVK